MAEYEQGIQLESREAGLLNSVNNTYLEKHRTAKDGHWPVPRLSPNRATLELG